MVGFGSGGRRPHRLTLVTIVGAIMAAAIAIIAVTGCGNLGTDHTTLAGPSPTPGRVTTSAGVPPAPAGQPKASPSTTKTPPLTVRVPNVVGKDLQSAQEELFPPLRSTSIDATGQGRLQIIDSNWIVIRQEPAAGKLVLVLTDIKLFVVKKGESAR